METNTLQLVLDKQAQFQSKFGFNTNIPVEKTSELIHTHSMFIIEEVFEMLRELPFHKPWKDYSDMDRDEIVEAFENGRKEWIDIFIFVMNVGLFLGFNENLIRDMYLEKLGINHERQEDPKLGYIKK